MAPAFLTNKILYVLNDLDVYSFIFVFCFYLLFTNILALASAGLVSPQPALPLSSFPKCKPALVI